MVGSKSQRSGSEANPERYLLQGDQREKERWQASYTPQYRYRTLHRMDYKRKVF